MTVPPDAPVSHLKSRHDGKNGHADDQPRQVAAEHLQRTAHGRRRGWGRAVDEAVDERGDVAAPAVGDGERADRRYQSALADLRRRRELALPRSALSPP